MVVTAWGNPTHLSSFYLCAAPYKRGKQCPALTAADRQPATLKRKMHLLGTPTEMLASGDSFSKRRKVFISVVNENKASGCAVDLSAPTATLTLADQFWWRSTRWNSVTALQVSIWWEAGLQSQCGQKVVFLYRVYQSPNGQRVQPSQHHYMFLPPHQEHQ